jgi:hypothetical protein
MNEARKQQIVAALVALVDAINRQRLENPPRIDEMRVYKISDLRALPPEHSITSDPVGASLRLGIRNIGEVLNAEGGQKLMEAICDQVDCLPKYAGTSLPAVIIDHAWDGIGGWYA